MVRPEGVAVRFSTSSLSMIDICLDKNSMKNNKTPVNLFDYYCALREPPPFSSARACACACVYARVRAYAYAYACVLCLLFVIARYSHVGFLLYLSSRSI